MHVDGERLARSGPGRGRGRSSFRMPEPAAPPTLGRRHLARADEREVENLDAVGAEGGDPGAPVYQTGVAARAGALDVGVLAEQAPAVARVADGVPGIVVDVEAVDHARGLRARRRRRRGAR